jgi:Zn finger protein HypA/HybF involved in hydrogenase expression
MATHARPARLPIPSTVACDQCSGSMHRKDRLFVCDRCGRAKTVASVAKDQPVADLTEG